MQESRAITTDFEMLKTQRKPRFAFVSTMAGYPWGGSEELWSQTALELLRRNCEITTRTSQWAKEPDQIAALRKAGCVITFAKPERFTQRLVSRLLRRPKDSQLRRWLLNSNPDLVVISQGEFKDGIGVAELSRSAGVPYCLIVQAAADWAWPSDELRASLCAAYQNASACFFVSKANLQLVTDFCGGELPAAEVVWNPFNVDYDASPPWPPNSADLRLACVARLEPGAKGQDILFRVLAKEKWRKRQIMVDLYGAGPKEEGLKGLAGYLGLKNISFKGHIKDIREVWSRYEALILPSRFEGLPLALVEAMLCGRPAIVTDVAGNAEVMQNGCTGFVAAAPTVELLDQAMECAWQKRTSLREMGVRAAVRIRELVPRNPAARFADKLEKLLQQ